MKDASSQTSKGDSLTPALFVGHGSPMNAIEENEWARGFRDIGDVLGKPEAILCISAHWYDRGIWLTGSHSPRTIHDFGGFPRELFEVEYPAPGNVDLAKRVRELVGRERASLEGSRGFDHGSWAVFEKMYPAADVPLIQLSLDRGLTARQHLELAKSLRPLREEGVLIVGSGNVTHNLRHAMPYVMRAIEGRESEAVDPPGWAARFDRDIVAAVEDRDDDFLIGALDTDDGRMSHPTADHYLPLLYTYGASTDEDEPAYPIEGFDASSLSMRSILLG